GLRSWLDAGKEKDRPERAASPWCWVTRTTSPVPAASLWLGHLGKHIKPEVRREASRSSQRNDALLPA
ncbi:MAG TPA: hypothetical protein VNV87_06805, partial [Acidimicrobiales bacterium]|nr:hypothetical protein [Acidimicrobiales bacterium]